MALFTTEERSSWMKHGKIGQTHAMADKEAHKISIQYTRSSSSTQDLAGYRDRCSENPHLETATLSHIVGPGRILPSRGR